MILDEQQVKDVHGAWFDASTIMSLCETPLLRERHKAGVPRTDCNAYANQLGRLTVYDAVLVDSRGLESLKIDLPAELKCCYPVSLSDEFYVQAAKAVQDAFSFKAPDIRAELANSGDAHYWWDGADKQIFDEMARRYPLGPYGSTMLCDTANSYARVVFYLELARSTQKTILLTPSKNRLLFEMHRAVQPQMLERIQLRAEELFGSWKPSGAGAPSIFETEVGPLGEYILSFAKDNGCSPFEAVEMVRGEETCIRFRKLLAELELLARTGRRAAKDLKKAEEELTKVSSLWRQKTDIERRGLRRNLDLTAIPNAGLLSTVGLGNVTVPDFDLWRDPSAWYFVAKWYS